MFCRKNLLAPKFWAKCEFALGGNRHIQPMLEYFLVKGLPNCTGLKERKLIL